MYGNPEKVLNLFRQLEGQNIAYAVLRDLEHSIPDKVDNTKDIDIIVYEKDKDKFHKFMKQNKFTQVRHPWNFENNFVFLYAMDPLEFYVKDIFHLDICYQLCCRSSDHGEWLPIDQMVQKSVWENRRKNLQYGYFQLSAEDEFVHLITRCIFDKNAIKNRI